MQFLVKRGARGAFSHIDVYAHARTRTTLITEKAPLAPLVELIAIFFCGIAVFNLDSYVVSAAWFSLVPAIPCGL